MNTILYGVVFVNPSALPRPVVVLLALVLHTVMGHALSFVNYSCCLLYMDPCRSECAAIKTPEVFTRQGQSCLLAGSCGLVARAGGEGGLRMRGEAGQTGYYHHLWGNGVEEGLGRAGRVFHLVPCRPSVEVSRARLMQQGETFTILEWPSLCASSAGTPKPKRLREMAMGRESRSTRPGTISLGREIVDGG